MIKFFIIFDIIFINLNLNYKSNIMRKIIYEYLSDDDFLAITKSITESEKTHSGEIRISVNSSLSFLENFFDIKKLAIREFKKLGMENTRDKTGVLIYISLTKKQFYILADEGINQKVSQSYWDSLAENLKNEFIIGNYRIAIIETITNIGIKLSEFFPRKVDDTDELSNKVVI